MSKFSIKHSLNAYETERNVQDSRFVDPKKGTLYRLSYFARALGFLCLLSIASTTSISGQGAIPWSDFET